MSSPLRLVAWTALVGAAVLIFVATGQYDSMGTVESRLLNQAMVVLVLGGWLLVALVRPEWRPVTPLLVPLAIAAGTYTFSALFSQRPRLSLEPLLGGLAIALWYLFLVTLLRHAWFRTRIATLLVTGVILIAGAYLAEVAFEWAVFYKLSGAWSLPPLRPSWADLNLGSPNLIATALLIIGPLGVAILHRRSHRTWPAALLALAVGAAIVITGSRGAYIGAGAALVVAVILGAPRDARVLAASLIMAARRRRVLLLPIVLIPLAGLALAPVVALRFAQGGESLRLDLWRSAVAILVAHPILGGGPGTWVQLKVEANPAGAANLILPHAHNMYVQIAAELGIAGVAALGFLGVTVASRIWIGLRRRGDAHAVAVGVGLAGLLGQSLVDNLVNLPFVCLLILITVAWLDAGLVVDDEAPAAQSHRMPTIGAAAGPVMGLAAFGRWLDGISRRLARPVVVLALVALIVALPTLVRTDRAVLAQARGNAADRVDPAIALAAYDEALSLDPDVTLYTIQRARELARLNRTAEARAELSRAASLDPVAINVLDLALLDEAMGDQPAAIEHARLAAARAPMDMAIALNVGLMAGRFGHVDLAADQLAQAVSLRPSIAGLSILRGIPGVPLAAIVSKARRLVTEEQAALITAYAGDPITARRELEARPSAPLTRTLIAACLWLGGDTSGAITRLEAIVAASPLNYVAAAWLTVVLRSAGDPAAGRYGRLARLVQGDAWPTVADDLTARVAEPGDLASALPSDYPWAVYIRGYGDLTVPGITLIVPSL